jgi:Tn3 transposase DDE domain-containing protein
VPKVSKSFPPVQPEEWVENLSVKISGYGLAYVFTSLCPLPYDGLQVIENWNSANTFIFYGKGGEIASNRLEDQELAMLALHLLQMAMVYINTLMMQQVLTCGGHA